MALGSRIVTALLALVLLVLVVRTGSLPLGLSQAWWAREQVITRVDPPPQPPLKSLFTKPAAPAPKVAAPKAAPNANAPAPPLLAREKAEAERLAALKQKDETVAKPAPNTKLYYRVVVRDGGTLEAGGIVISLGGIAARDADAECKDEKGKAWPCGARARAALTRLIRARAVSCALPASGEQKSFTARCAVGDIDLSVWMVGQGWAKPKEPKEAALAEAEKAAHKKRIGIWRSGE
jgi:endonuclease YncB( thermonuclease family)